MDDQISVEYAIYVEGAGWVCGADAPPYQVTVGGDRPSVYCDRDNALKRANTIANDYKRLGLSHMRDKITIQTRTVTVSRTDWVDIREPVSAEHGGH